MSCGVKSVSNGNVIDQCGLLAGNSSIAVSITHYRTEAFNLRERHGRAGASGVCDHKHSAVGTRVHGTGNTMQEYCCQYLLSLAVANAGVMTELFVLAYLATSPKMLRKYRRAA